MAENKAQFAIELKDQVSGPARTASNALSSLQERINADTAALRQMQGAMSQLKQGNLTGVAEFRKLKDAIDAKKASIASARQEYLKLGGTFQQVKPQAHAAVASLDALARETKKIGLGGPDAIMDLVGAVSTVPGAAITATAALVALSGAVIGLGITALGSLLSKAFSVQEELFGVSQEVIDLAKNSPLARSEIQKMAKDLEATGLKGAALSSALEKAVGKAGAGKSMLGLSTQVLKAKENISLLFAGVKTGPLLEATQKFLGLLDESTSTGQALKTLIETILNPLIGGVAQAGPAMQQFFKGMIIGALKATIIFLTLKNNIKDAVGELDVSEYVPDWVDLGQAAIIAAGAFVVVAGVVAVAVGALVAIGGAFAWIPVGVGLGLVKIAQFVAGVAAAIMSVNNFIISRVSAMIDAGFQFAAGLADGIRNGISEVIGAATEVAQGAVKAVKDTLKIKSPSEVMAQLGVQTSAGMQQGMDRGAPGVKGAGVSLGQEAAGGAAKGASGGGKGPLIGSLVININGGGGDASGIEQAVKRGIEMALEDAAHSMGAPLEAAI